MKAKPTALGNQVRAAAAGFQPIAGGAVAQSKAELQQAVAVLDTYLRSLGAWEAQWKDYLFWNQMTAELAKPNNYDVATLMRVQRRYSGGFVGLEEPEFRAVGDALLKFAHLADAAQNAKLADEYKTRLNALADAVDAVGSGAPTAAQSVAIAENVAWLDACGQAPQVVQLIGTKYSQPNLLIDVSETFVVDALSRPVDQTEPVVDCILGTYITGTGRTIGEVNVDVVPNGEQAELVTYLSGINYSRTVGHNRSALIYSQGATTLNGQSTLYVNEQGLAGGPINTSARVNNRITGYGSTKGGLIGNLVKKIAAKKAPQQKAQGERVAAAHARTRLARSMQKEIVQQVAQANEELEARLRRPLLRFGQYPSQLKYASTDDSLTIRALQTTSGRLAAPGEAPALAGGAPVSVRVHQSLVTNSSQGMLAGRKFDQPRIQLLAESILGEVPERLKPQPGQEPFSITFADADPVLLSFDGDKATFTIRGKAFTSGDKKFDGMNISGVYKLSSDGHGLKAVREGEFDIVPPGFVRGKDKLNTRQIVLKRILTEKFGKALPAEIVRSGEPVDGDASKGTIYVSSLKASGDWLVLGLKRDPAAAAQVEAQ
ncbi:MAG: hypothetical protein JNK76_14085 [Planctomycetales bacterium]|nr:hypothetical protein [Planctomycetales bacterium]MBN8624499.1 hypothetical protein [Planctomycetota bacterium]